MASPESEPRSAAPAETLPPWERAVGLVGVVFLAQELLPVLLARVLYPQGVQANGGISTLELLALHMPGQLLVITLGLLLRKDMGKGKWAWWLALPCYGLVLLPWNGITNNYLQWLQGEGQPVQPQEVLQSIADLPLDGWQFWMMVFSAAVLAPVAEEVMFRGFLRDALLRLGTPVAWIGTSVLFGLAHGYELAFPLALLGGFLFWLRHMSGGLWAPILAHAVHNSLSILLVRVMPDLLPLKPD